MQLGKRWSINGNHASAAPHRFFGAGFVISKRRLGGMLAKALSGDAAREVPGHGAEYMIAPLVGAHTHRVRGPASMTRLKAGARHVERVLRPSLWLRSASDRLAPQNQATLILRCSLGFRSEVVADSDPDAGYVVTFECNHDDPFLRTQCQWRSYNPRVRVLV